MADSSSEHGVPSLFAIEDLHARPIEQSTTPAPDQSEPDGVNAVRSERAGLGVMLITQYQKLLDYITPDVVHILLDGRIVDSGGPELAKQLEHEGFDQWRATT